jgi:hypothetical protein
MASQGKFNKFLVRVVSGLNKPLYPTPSALMRPQAKRHQSITELLTRPAVIHIFA